MQEQLMLSMNLMSDVLSYFDHTNMWALTEFNFYICVIPHIHLKLTAIEIH